MGSATVLKLEYLSLAEIAARPAGWWQEVLGVAAFDAAPPPAPLPHVPMVRVALPTLAGNARRYEVWSSTGATAPARLGRIQYRRTGDAVFGCLTLEHSTGDASCGRISALQQLTESAYREIFKLIDSLAMPHLVRVWNYLPDINGETHGSERYWQFNSARQDAFIACKRAVTGAVPAACGVGSAPGTAVVIYFLASSVAATVLENPRQVSAYHYPPEYSPRSPTFSRACVSGSAGAEMLYISGTASILGHATVHVGDAAAQARETLVNIQALLDEANRGPGAARFSSGTLFYKAYLRHAADQAAVQGEISRALSPAAQVMYLHAELCRKDLLIEIEATGAADGGRA